MPCAREAYDELIATVREITLLGSCSALLHWDRETYMPPKGAEHRAEQLALLAGMTHEEFTDPHVGDLIAASEDADCRRDFSWPDGQHGLSSGCRGRFAWSELVAQSTAGVQVTPREHSASSLIDGIRSRGLSCVRTLTRA